MAPTIAIEVLGALRRVNRVVRRFRPDIIHLYFPATSPYARAMELRWGVPFVSTLCVEYNAVSSLLVRRYHWGARAIGISSDISAILVKRFGVPEDRVTTIFCGTDDTHFRPPTALERREARAAFALKPDQPCVALVGNLVDDKGHEVLVEAIGRLRTDGTDVVALCAGQGPREGQVRELARRRGVSDLIRLLGYTDVRPVLWASDGLVLLSESEGFGSVVSEAMLCRVVPIRTPAGGARDQIVDGREGLLVPFDDPGAVAAAIHRLVTDPHLRRKMAEAALAKAKASFTVTTMTDDTMRVYDEVLESRR